MTPELLLLLRLEAEPVLPQQVPDSRSGHRVSLPCQLVGEVPQRLRRPPKRRHRIAPLVRLYQRQQGWSQLRVQLRDRLAPTTRLPDAADRQGFLAPFEFEHPLAHGRLADTSHAGDSPDTAVAEQPGLYRQRQALLALVQMRKQHLEPCGELTTNLRRNAHTSPTTHEVETNTLFPYGSTRSRMCSVPCPKSAHPGAKKALAEIWNAEDKRHALDAVRSFEAAYGAKFPKAVAKITDDVEVLLAFYDFPAEHWIHLRTTNPIESTFATVRHRTKITRGPGSRAAGLAMAFKLIEAAQDRWRAVNGPHLVALVRAGATFVNGKLVERPDDHHQPEAA